MRLTRPGVTWPCLPSALGRDAFPWPTPNLPPKPCLIPENSLCVMPSPAFRIPGISRCVVIAC